MIIEDLLKELMDKKGSDLHISNGLPPVIRLDGKLVRLDYEPLTSEGVEALLFPMMSNEQRRKLEQEWELDFSYGVEGIGRFRVNFYKDKGSYAAAFRTIATTAPQLEELGMPPIVTTIADILDVEDKNHSVEFYEKLLELNPNSKRALQKLAEFRERIGDYREMVNYMDRLKELEPNNPYIRNNYDRIQEKMNSETSPLDFIKKLFKGQMG